MTAGADGDATPAGAAAGAAGAAAAEAARAEREALRRLWQIYTEAVLPLERNSNYEHFVAPPITQEEFNAKPQVLLVGQYSTGKTSMVRWLTGSESPHFDIRPQPSTDKFMAVVHGEKERLINGNAAACLPMLPYQGLSVFGASFLNNFRAIVMPADILRDVSFIDTPGVLSGSKQTIGRNYDFASISKWMAERADLVLLTFDAHKLDISDEFKEVMEVLRPYGDKVRCVLNKADQLDAANLVRVNGALHWNLGKIFRTPEVTKVFVSSFWAEPYRFTDHSRLFDEDKDLIIKELRGLPRTALLRKIDEFVARVRRVRAHLCIVTYMQSQVPWRTRAFAGDDGLRKWLGDNLPRLLDETQKARKLSTGDMPQVEPFQAKLATYEHVGRMPTWNPKDLTRLDQVIDTDVPRLISRLGGGGVSASQLSLADPEPGTPPCAARNGVLGFLGRPRPGPY